MYAAYISRNRPGVYRTIENRANTGMNAPSSESGGGGGQTAGKLIVSSDGVLIYTGAAPTMDGTTLVFNPTPTMVDTVMTIG